MANEWRVKKYYNPRITVETSRILDTTFPDILVCLTGSQVELLRNMCGYLSRRSTFVSEAHEQYYLAPSNDEWDSLQEIVAELEYKLMACDMDLLIDAINTQTSVIDVLRQCVCETMTYQQKIASGLPDVGGYVENLDVTYLSTSETEGVFTPAATDTIRCEQAQSIWYYTYQMYTETLLPFADTTSDNLTALIVGSVGFGALAGFVGIPVAVLSAIVLAIIAWGIAGAIANFRNWMLGTKDEIICLLYNSLPDTSAAAQVVGAYIDAAVELSYLDKMVLKTVLASSWHYGWILLDQETNSTWDDYFVPGQCTLCDAPIPGCWEFGPCDLPTWIGGNVECAYDGVLLTGGSTYWNVQSVTPVSGDYFIVRWTPRYQSAPTGRGKFGFVRVSDLQVFHLITTAERDNDVSVTEHIAVPSQLWGVSCYFWMMQDSQAIEPHYFCLSQVPPS